MSASRPPRPPSGPPGAFSIRASRPDFGSRRLIESFSTTADQPLYGDVDIASILANIPRDYALKGMFFTRFVDETWSELENELLEPPPNGKYLAFEWYPMSDCLRVFDRFARMRFPGATREAYRLLARGEVEVLAATTLGKVTFSMLREPEAAMLRCAELFKEALSRGPTYTVESSPGCVTVIFDDFVSPTEQMLGALEGFAMAFDLVPSVDVEIYERRRAIFRVRW